MRLIDADALIGVAKRLFQPDKFNHAYVRRRAIDLINNAPTVEIIRCKDCYFCDYSNFHKSYCCSRFDNFGDGVLLKVDAENDFCSFAEREKR